MATKLSKIEMIIFGLCQLHQSAHNLQNKTCFSEPFEMSPRSAMLQSKLMNTKRFPVGSQCSQEISLHVDDSVLL